MPKIVKAALSWESLQCGLSNKRAGKLEAIRRIKRAMIAGWSSFNSQLLPIQFGILDRAVKLWPTSHARKAMIDNILTSQISVSERPRRTLLLGMFLLCGTLYSFMLSTANAQRAMREYTEAWAFKHPSPWDFVFSMSKSLDMELGWFWYCWLWTTESVDGSIESVTNVDSQMSVTIKHDGEMPAPVVLKIEFAADGPDLREVSNAKVLDDGSAIVTWPADVWFDGNRKFEAKFDFGERKIEKITLDPNGRFPDKDVADNVWTRHSD